MYYLCYISHAFTPNRGYKDIYLSLPGDLMASDGVLQ